MKDNNSSVFAEGVIYAAEMKGLNMRDFAFSLAEIIHRNRQDSNQKIKNLKIQIEDMDAIARNHEIQVTCRSCHELFTPDCELSEITPDGSYCGKDHFCCP